MAELRKFRIETDRGIARALLNTGTRSRRELNARAQLVGIHYRREYAKSAPSRGASPFEQKEISDKSRSVTDPKAFSVKIDQSRGEIIISITAPAAGFVEVGNAPGPSGKKMAIRVKPSKVRHSRGKRGGKKLTLDSGTKVRFYQGKYYIFAQKVRPAKGRFLLEKAVRTAFRF